ncbi:PIG-L deacetylase family protein [Vibrio breoganii]|uniref:PIG-L deacetylase family protein n=1 Tax=Vibrio breoganii TaxID=553239 RepID=UPI0021C2AA02|nr:PIG-L family deacetylase [Vibrio breoganii]MDN3715924.1 PIG-L family deacetylase [Vibrio breoganii]
MKNEFKNILVLAPHTDDGEIGAGGTISKFIEQGSNVDYVAFSACEESVPECYDPDILRTEVLDATSQLGIINENVTVLNFKVRYFSAVRQDILETLVKLKNSKQYDLVLLPSSQDIHQDHATIYQEGVRAFKTTNIWGYELNWNQLTTNNIGFVVLEEQHIKKKDAAIASYRSQSKRYYTTADYTSSLAKVRGAQIGTKYSECFEVIRMVIR